MFHGVESTSRRIRAGLSVSACMYVGPPPPAGMVVQLVASGRLASRLMEL